MGSYRYVLRFYLAATLFTAIPGCGDEDCRSGEQRCDGQFVSTCQTISCHACLIAPTVNRWVSQECPEACVEDKGQAFCALSSEPDSRCHAGSSGLLCAGSELVSCRSEFLTAARDCDVACIAPSAGVAFCAASADPDPGCESDEASPSMMCSGNTVERCTEGYAECFQPFPLADLDDDAGTR